MADGITPGTEGTQALLWDRDTVHLQRPTNREASMSPVRDEAASIQGGRQGTPDSTHLSMPDVSWTSDYAGVPDQPFRLMDLPVELRYMIFREFLVMPGPVLFRTFARKRLAPFSELDEGAFENMAWSYDDIFGSYGDVMGFDDHFIGSPDSMMIRQSSLFNIFSASKTVYLETVPLYFGFNQFEFENLDCMEKFIGKVGAAYRWQITSISVGYIGRAPAKAFKRLNECVGLRELTLSLYWFGLRLGTADTKRKVSMPGMKDLLRIRGLDKVKIVADDEAGWALRVSDLDSLKKQLEVLKEPRDPKQVKRQEKKNFPTKAKRTVFGAANVVTRSEKQRQNTQQ